MESDATISNVPTEKVRKYLSQKALLVRTSDEPVYVSIGHCLKEKDRSGSKCSAGTTAYFMNPTAAQVGAKLDFCKDKTTVDHQIRNGMCTDGVQCTWAKGLVDMERCKGCVGDGLFP